MMDEKEAVRIELEVMMNSIKRLEQNQASVLGKLAEVTTQGLLDMEHTTSKDDTDKVCGKDDELIKEYMKL